MSSPKEHCCLGKCRHSSESLELNDSEWSIAHEAVVSRYSTAGEIASRVMSEMIGLCVDGAEIHRLCDQGDRRIVELCGNVFKKDKKMMKGIAMPTCVSVNNRLAYYSPMESDEKTAAVLKDGDVVKLELGAHVDGYPSIIGHTLVVGASHDNPVKDKRADAIVAAYKASVLVGRMFKPERKIQEISKLVSEMIQKDFGCNAVENWFSYTISRNNIENDYVLSLGSSDTPASAIGPLNGLQDKDYANQKVSVNTVCVIDVAVSTGEGKVKDCEVRTNVFRKTDSVYQLKVKASRSVLSEVDRKFGNMIFSMRNLSNPSIGRMGVIECLNHQVFAPYHVQQEKEGEFIARFMTTLMVTANSTKPTHPQIPLDFEIYCTTRSISHPELVSLMAQSVSKKKKRSKTKKTSNAPSPNAS